MAPARSRMDEILAARAAARLAVARERVDRLLDAARAEGLDVVPIGSFATGRFMLHSDVDLLVRGPIDTPARVRAERIAAGAFRGSGIPYDLIFACDLSPERLKEFEHDLVAPADLREDRTEAGAREP